MTERDSRWKGSRENAAKRFLDLATTDDAGRNVAYAVLGHDYVPAGMTRVIPEGASLEDESRARKMLSAERIRRERRVVERLTGPRRREREREGDTEPGAPRCREGHVVIGANARGGRCVACKRADGRVRYAERTGAPLTRADALADVLAKYPGMARAAAGYG